MRTGTTSCNSLLVPSKLPDTDLVANPYVGCAFGCTYCYASFMSRQVGESPSDWGTFVCEKEGALEACTKDLDRLAAKNQSPRILLSSVTDPYQGAERKSMTTRGILEEFSRRRYSGGVSVLTKSSLVLRDIDVIRTLPRVEVGLTVTLPDDPISRALEARAPRVESRLSTLRRLAHAGIETYAFLGPIPPHIVEHLEDVTDLIGRVHEAGVKAVFVEHLNATRSLRARIRGLAVTLLPSAASYYDRPATPQTLGAIDAAAREAIAHRGLHLRTGEVIVHERPCDGGGRKSQGGRGRE